MINIFGNKWCSSGARGFFGEGYWYSGHRLDKTTFVGKTVTWEPRLGNMILKEDSSPIDFWPDCIKINFRKGSMLNAVGLSNLGAEALFETGIWQRRQQPTILSFMSIGDTRSDRMEDLQKYINLFEKCLPDFISPVALQINFSCPNVGSKYLINDIKSSIEIARTLGIPLIPKINCCISPLIIKELKGLDAICISNTIPWGKFPDLIPWTKLFGEKSPLEYLGGGGLSGKYIVEPIHLWMNKAKLSCPIVTTAGQSIKDMTCMSNSGAAIYELGSVNLLRPWRVKGMLL